MKRIIYFIGFAAVGKKTLIKKILAEKHSIEYGISLEDKVEAIGYSFKSLREIADNFDVLLVQWQPAEHHKVKELREIFPDAEHTYVFLLRDWNQHQIDHRRIYSHLWKPSINEMKLTTMGILERYFCNQIVIIKVIQ